MAKAVIQSNIFTTSGALDVAGGASVEIRDSDSGALVQLWSDRAGTTTTSNPFNADVNGFFRVYANPARVNITATIGAEVQTFRDVVIDSGVPETFLTIQEANASAALFADGQKIFITDSGHGGNFVYDTSILKTEHDGGTIFDPDIDMTTWTYTSANAGFGVLRRLYDGSVNVKWFGAKGDGVTNDSLPVISTISTAVRLNNLTVKASYGEYAIYSKIELPAGVHLYGDGSNETMFKLFGGQAGFVSYGQTSRLSGFKIIGDETITSIVTNGGSISGQVGLEQTGSSVSHYDIVIERCDIGILLKNAYLVRHVNVLIRECRKGYLQIGTVDYGDGVASDRNQNNTWIGGGIVSCFIAASLQQSRNLAFIGTDFERCAYAFEVFGPVYNIAFRDSWIEQAFYAVYLKAPGYITGDTSTILFDNSFISCERDSTMTGAPGDDIRNQFVPYGLDPILSRSSQRILYVEDSYVTGTIGVSHELEFTNSLFVSGADNLHWGEFEQSLTRPVFNACRFSGVSTLNPSVGITAFTSPTIFRTPFTINDDDVTQQANLPSGSDLYTNGEAIILNCRVGAGGEFSTINRALEYASRIKTYYKKSPANKIIITIASGYVISEQILVDGVDFSHVEIISEDPTVTVSRSSLVDAFYGYFPFFGCNQGNLPFLNFSFSLDTSGVANTSHTGIFAVRGGTSRVSGSISWNGGRALLSERGATIEATDVAASGSTIADIAVNRGGIIVAHGSTGVKNQTVNTLTTSGIIFG